MDYKTQLTTSAWLRVKYEVMKRDNFVCSECMCDNSERQLEVHHVAYYPNRMAWEYPDYLLVTLCRDCHQKEHDRFNIFKPKQIIKWITRLVLNRRPINK
jgi:5-methylcytosine-specific restriction endonuclease McrA